jgi:hypothetical protein
MLIDNRNDWQLIVQDFKVNSKIYLAMQNYYGVENPIERDPTNIFRVAAIGHRFLSVNDRLTVAIGSVLGQILQEHVSDELQLFCALAEGSDQLVAKIALLKKSIKLIVPLPLAEEKYLQGFTTESGRNSFHEIIKSAEKVFTLPEQNDDEAAYEHLGNYLLNHSDVLIAIWNGEQSLKKGGTGQIASKALHMRKLTYWIYADNGNESGVARRKPSKKTGDIEIIGGSRDRKR